MAGASSMSSDGRTRTRTTSASIRTATASPTPSSFISIMCSEAKIVNTDTMTRAALVTVPADRVIPARTASDVLRPLWAASRIWFRTKTW